jgi:Golgi phosphoprotein 3
MLATHKSARWTIGSPHEQDQVGRMSSTTRLSRRRVGGHSYSSTTADDDTSSTPSLRLNGGSRSNLPPIPAFTSHQGSGLSCTLGLSYAYEGGCVGSGIQHAGSAFEGGSKVAFDPRDLAQDAGEEARIGERCLG